MRKNSQKKPTNGQHTEKRKAGEGECALWGLSEDADQALSREVGDSELLNLNTVKRMTSLAHITLMKWGRSPYLDLGEY